MDFRIKPQIDKNYLLSYYSEETYLSHYLNLPVKKGLFKNPLRRDNKVTCSFYKSKSGDILFHDFATGEQLNFIGVVMSKYNVGYYEAMSIIAEDFGLKESKRVKNSKNYQKLSIKDAPKFEGSGPSKIGVEIKNFTKTELDWWKEYGVSPEILKKYNVYSCKNVFLNDKLFTTNSKLTFGYYGGKLEGMELWRIYYSQREQYRFLTNWPSKKVQGYKQLPKEGKLLVITKSMKDVMCLAGLGISAIAPNSENIFISDKMLEDLKKRFKHIVVFYDNDRPGLRNMVKIRKNHPELNFFWIPLNKEAKDISDFYKKFKKQKTLEFIKESILKLK